MKKEATIKAMSVFLALVFVLLTPGMYIGAADADREETSPFNEDIVWDEMPESEIEGIIPLEKDSTFQEKVESAKKSGDLVQYDQNDSKNYGHNAVARTQSTQEKERINNLRSGSTYANTTAYLRYAHPVFSATTANTSSVYLSSGSFNVGYPLASFSGRGGIEASIQLIYDSSNSETKEKHWGNVPSNEYYAITGDRYDRVVDEYSLETTYANIVNHHFTSESDYLDFIDDYVPFEDEMPDYVGMIGDDYYDIYYDVLIDDGNISYPVEDVRDKSLSSAEIGLAPGWRFNIPVIEKLDSAIGSGDTTNTDDYSILTLDDGSSYQLRNNTILNRNIQDVTVSSVNTTVNSRIAKYLVTLKDGTSYYFDNDGAIILKQDRFGNTIYYDFSSGMISRIYDATGRGIDIATSTTGITITSPDGRTAEIGISGTGYENKRIGSVSYGANETYSFTYTNSVASFSYLGNGTSLNTTWALLTGISMPNGDSTTISYTQKYALYGNGYMWYPVVSSRYDTIGGNDKNSKTYAYTGTAQDAYYYRTLHAQYPSNDPYTFTVTVTEGTAQKTYEYNEKVCLTSEQAKIGTTLIEETVYQYEGILPTKITYNSLSKYGIERYFYDSKGNITSFYDTMSNGYQYSKHSIHYTYSNNYSICLTKTYYQNEATTIVETNTLTQNGKSVASSVKTIGNSVLSRTEYTYDSYGNVSTMTEYIYPGNETAVTSYSYADNVTRPAGISMGGVYCTSVTVTGIKDADGVTQSDITTSKTYDLCGRVTSETNALGNTTSYTYNTEGKLASVSYPDNTSETYTYSAANGTVTHTDVSGLALMTTYNGLGDVVSVTDVQTTTVLSSTTYDSMSRVYREYTCMSVTPYSYKEYTYDALGRVTAEQVKNGSNTLISKKTYTYTPSQHKITETIVGDTNAPSISTVMVYDCLGRVTSSTVGTSTTTYTYDYLGNVLTETDPANYTTTYTYTPTQRKVAVKNALNATTTTVYDSLGRTLTVTDALNNVTTYTYDVLGRVLTATAPVDTGVTALTKTYYDAAGNVTETKVQNGTSSFSRTVNTYDTMNRVTSTSSYDGSTVASSTSYTYNARGQVLTSTTGNATISYGYDRFGNNTSITDALNQTETYTYNIGGMLTSSVDRNGVTTTYTYRAPGSISSKTATKTGETTVSLTYTYTATGAIRSETSGGVTLTYTYDNRGNVLSETETDGSQTVLSEYTYDARNLRLTSRVKKGTTVLSYQYYKYNAIGNMTESGNMIDVSWDETLYNEVLVTSYIYGPSTVDAYKIIIGGTDDIGTYTTYTGYSANGHSGIWFDSTLFELDLTELGEEMLDATGSISTSSGGYLQKPGLTNPTPISITTNADYDLDYIADPFYFFDSTGTVIYTLFLNPMYYFGALYIGNAGYQYTNQVPVQHVELVPYTVHHEAYEESPVVTYTYDALGRVTQATNSNNTKTQYTYTTGGLVKTIKNYTGTTLTSSSAYTYYPNGNVATDTENTGKVTTYLYDDLGRLTSEAITGTNNNSTLTYTYDDRGNRLTQSRGNATVTYTYDLNNRLTSHTASGVVTIYSYDNNGNTISTYVGGNFAGGYTYDLFNRQKTYTPDGTVFTTTTYRPDGMRHSIGTTKHIWDAGNIVGDLTGSTYKQYFRALNLIYNLVGTTKQYYRYNGHGDVVALTNATGTVTKTYTYNAFGEEQNIDATDANPFRYCGEYFDKVSGTLYLRARNYNASIGRFTQEDPIRDGINWYGYCANNPINCFDPLGLAWWHWLAAAAIVVACAAATVVTCGGFAAAACAIGAVAAGATSGFGVAATVCAGATLFSATALASSTVVAACESKSLDDFANHGEAALISTGVGAVVGAAYGLVLEGAQAIDNRTAEKKSNESSSSSADSNSSTTSETKSSSTSSTETSSDSSKTAETKSVPNPDGRKGCQEHQNAINEQVKRMEESKEYVDIKREYRIGTEGGYKNSRSVDVAGIRKDGSVDIYQVGVTNKTGSPNTYEGAVARERKAIDDIINYGNVIINKVGFITYKTK